MAALVGGDEARELGQRLVAGHLGQARGVAVRHLGGALLEAGVDEAHVRVVLRAGVHSGADQPLHGLVNRPAVHPPREPEVAGERLAVPLLLRHPGARPGGPGRRVRAGVVAYAVQSVDHAQVGWQRLFCYHISHQHHHERVRQARRAAAQLGELGRARDVSASTHAAARHAALLRARAWSEKSARSAAGSQSVGCQHFSTGRSNESSCKQGSVRASARQRRAAGTRAIRDGYAHAREALALARWQSARVRGICCGSVPECVAACAAPAGWEVLG